MEHTSTFYAIKVISVQCSPAHKEAPERFGRTRSRKFSRSEARRRKHAWINRGSSDCSLVARIFRIPRNHQFHSHCFNRGPSISRAAFHERQRSKRVEGWPASDPVEAAIPICERSGFLTGQDEARGNSGRIRIYRLKIGVRRAGAFIEIRESSWATPPLCSERLIICASSATHSAI
jgi:hypothetical protein